VGLLFVGWQSGLMARVAVQRRWESSVLDSHSSRRRPLSTRRRLPLLTACAAALVVAAPGVAATAGTGPDDDRGDAHREARAILASRGGDDRGQFKARTNVFFPATLGLANLRDPDTASVDLPLYTGIGPGGKKVKYILTEASRFKVARQLGVNFSPKLRYGIGTGGDQAVTLNKNGLMRFKGAIDFSPRRVLQAGTGPSAFPPAVAQPGGVGDAEWSGLVVLPSGTALNVMVVANRTGFHDRANKLDYRAEEVNFSLADGFQGGDQYYYHLVTESSDAVAATVEQGVYSPRLGNLPAAGKSRFSDRSARLGFAPTANGETGIGNPQRQGLNSTIVDDDRAPINVFPIDPTNGKRKGNNYSPMWDAHVYVWTDAAIAAGERRRVKGLADLRALKNAGLVTDAPTNAGPVNTYMAGLRASGLIINCPVIAQPFEGSRRLPVGPQG